VKRDLKATKSGTGLALACAAAVLCARPATFGQTNAGATAPADVKAATVVAPSASQAPASGAAPPNTASVPGPGATKAAAKGPRRLEGEELRLMLAEALESQLGKEGGELEIKLGRPWTPVAVPEGALSVEILEPPLNRLSSLCTVRFELRSGKALVGTWQASLQCHLWREVLVAHSSLQRGALLNETDFDKEKRDVLTLREAVCELPGASSGCELTQSVSLGSVLTSRAIRLKPVVLRGQTADGVVRDGAMMISFKVEVLEEGVPGQTVRVRNLQTRRELLGKVEDEQTIAIPL
jgi:flagella basal body P-ring formation protein FlgA